MPDQNKNIIHYSAADIHKYLMGELSAQEMNAMEKAALDDPFLSDAMDGMRNHLQKNSADDFNNDVNELKKRLAEKTQKEKKIIPLSRNIMWQRIAAVAVILIGSTFLVYNFVIKNSTSENKSIAVAKENKIADDTIASNNSSAAKKDSIVTNADVAIVEKPKTAKSVKAQSDQANFDKNFANTDSSKKENEVASAKQSETTYIPSASIAKSEERIKEKAVTSIKTDTLKEIAANAIPQSSAEKALEGKVAGLSISKRKNNRADFYSNSIQGRVIDENKNPIPAAIVMIKGKKVSTKTDQNGYFKLNNTNNNDSATNVVVNSVGFHQASATLNNNTSGNEIRLKQVTQSLSEVVVVGYGSSKKKEIVDTTYNADDDSTADINDEEDMTFNALPIIGWHDYNNYINKNKKISTSDSTIKGREIISFIVDKNDKVSSFKIKKSLSKSHDAEAIRLIREGPMWKLLRGKKEKITMAIMF